MSAINKGDMTVDDQEDSRILDDITQKEKDFRKNEKILLAK
jgi:hypothetical protein